MLNSSRLVMDADNGYWFEDEDLRVIKAYSSSPRESETTLFLWKNNLSPFERQRTYGRVSRNSPFLENLRVVEGLIERLQRRRAHIRSILGQNGSTGYLESPLSYISHRGDSSLQSCPNLESSTPIIQRNERGVSRISIKSRPESPLALPYTHRKSKMINPPTANNVHSSEGNSYFDESGHDIESISTEYASSTIPIDVDDRESHHFFSSLDDDSLIFSPDGEEDKQQHQKNKSVTRIKLQQPQQRKKHVPKEMPPPIPKKIAKSHEIGSGSTERNSENRHGRIKTNLLTDAFYHSTDIIDVDSPYNSSYEDDLKSRSFDSYHLSDNESSPRIGGRGHPDSSSFIRSLERSYTPVYNTEDRTPLSSLYSKYFDTTSGKGEIQKLF